MSSVWVIEQGEYSDYHVVGVFSTRENAELVLAKIKGDDYYGPSLAEWPLDPAVDALNQGLSRWLVWMRKDGTTERVEQQDVSTYNLADKIYEWNREEAPFFQGKDKPNVLMANVWATDSQHAIKIVNERRIQILAANEWKGKL